MKRALALVLTIALAGWLAACSRDGSSTPPAGSSAPGGGAAPAAKIVMKVSHAASPADARHKGAEKFKEVLQKETNGQVEVQIYPASQLGNPTETVEAMQAGTIEMVILPSAFLGGFQPLVTVLDLPFFLPRNADELLKLHKSDAVKAVLETTREKGIETIGIWHTGYKQFTANKPLVKPDDFKGVKFRAMPSPVLFGQFQVVGGNPINLPYSETYSALQTGAIDGQENPINTIMDMKFHEVQKAITLSYHGTLDQLIMFSKAWYDKQPANVKAAIQKAHEAAAQETFNITQAKEKSDLEAIKKTGKTDTIEVSAGQRAALIDAFSKAQDVYLKETGERGKKLLELMKSAMK